MKRILAIHDLSGWGHTSLMAVIPIMYSRGIQVAVLPSSILSTNTDYPGYQMLDLSAQMDASIDHWIALDAGFDAIYSGFLASPRQADQLSRAIRAFQRDSCPVLIDPVMADTGRLYSCYDHSMVAAMRRLIPMADIICPNLSEAALLLDEPYRPDLPLDQCYSYCRRLSAMGATTVLITSAFSPAPGRCATVGIDPLGREIYQENDYLPSDCPGAGDVFASVLLAELLSSSPLPRAIESAAAFVAEGIRLSLAEPQDPKSGMPLEKLVQRKIEV